ncbi:MAG TPA: hypothetical protein VGV61_10475 [Thermoanaerobaculia bacterium]|jgi:hypothetical protein|nr:hypothetical protein [Thermoanaerobaculia bacterium]
MSGHSPTTASPAGDLARLISSLRAARDPWSRLKLVAGGARALAQLNPLQRIQLLRQLGLEGAEELAEAAAGGNAATAAAFAQALHALEADPRRLQQLGAAIADPSSRRATLAGLTAHLIDAVTTPPGRAAGKAAALAGVPPAPPPAASVAPAPPGLAAAAPAPLLAPAPAGVTEAAQLPTPGPPQPSVPPPAPTLPAPTLAPPQPTTPQPPPPTTPLPEPLPAPVSPPVPAPPPAPPAPVTPLPPATGEGVSAGSPAIAGVPAAGGTLAVLRALRHRLAAGEVPTGDALAALLEHELTADWARRRALSALFAARGPAALDEALGLVARLERPADRRWALADLAGSREWDEAEWERLAAAADTPALRRRLLSRRLVASPGAA